MARVRGMSGRGRYRFRNVRYVPPAWPDAVAPSSTPGFQADAFQSDTFQS